MLVHSKSPLTTDMIESAMVVSKRDYPVGTQCLAKGRSFTMRLTKPGVIFIEVISDDERDKLQERIDANKQRQG